MANFFSRGNSNSGNQNNSSGSSGGGYDRGNDPYNRSNYGNGGLNRDTKATLTNNHDRRGLQNADLSSSNAIGSAWGNARSNAGMSDYSGMSVGPGSHFGSINNEDMERASISTFGNATSVASSVGGQQKYSDHGGRGPAQGSAAYSPLSANQLSGAPGGGDSDASNRVQQSVGSGQSTGGQSMSHHHPMNRGNSVGNLSMVSQSQADDPPVAIAADFKSETANIIFLSSESGQGANRQPMTKFSIHEVNLNVHSAILSEMVDDEEEESEDCQDSPVVLEEDAATLKLLFGLMYNRPSPPLSMSDWQVVLRMARAAQKYDCARAKEVAAAYFTEQEQLGALSPFMTYAFATQYKLEALEEAAAERSVRYDLHRLPELVFSMMGFSAYQKLSAFHARRQSFYSDVLGNISIDPKELADQCYQTGGVCAVGPWNKIKQRLQWPRQAGRDGSRKPPEPATVLRALVLEISSLDCGSCSRALAESCLTVQTALTSLPGYREDDEASF